MTTLPRPYDSHGLQLRKPNECPLLCWAVEAAIVDRGEHEAEAEALGDLRHGLVHRIRWLILRFRALLAEMYGNVGQPETGLTVLAEVLAEACTNGLCYCEAELYRLKGELLLQQATGSGDEANTCFRQALDVARRQQAKSWELRAATSLARLWQQQGKRAEAYHLLAPIYG
jgi:predicted ATPase